MARTALGTFLRHLRHTSGEADAPDRQLLRRYSVGRDEGAFEVLVRRHAPLVWGVCRRLLDDEHDAEDAFQASFLVLLRKADSLRAQESLASWLHAVACRVALKAKVTAVRRRIHEGRATSPQSGDHLATVEWQDLRRVLDEELDRLPEKYRLPLILCYLEGKSYAEAARQLGWPDGTVCGRLARARELLRLRLVRRGLTLSATAFLAGLTEPAPAASIGAVVRTAALFALGQSAGSVSAPVATLAHGILQTMAATKLKMIAALVAALCVFAAGAGWTAHQVLLLEPAEAVHEEQAKPSANKADSPKAEVVKQARKDFYGDPLPPGAVARMGSVQLRHEEAHIAFSADGKTLISAGGDGEVRFWDMTTGRQRSHTRIQLPKTPEDRPGVTIAGLSPDGKLVAVFSDQSLYLYDTATGEERRRLPVEGMVHVTLSFSANGKMLATLIGIRDSYAIRLWDLSTGKERLRLERLKQAGNILLSPDGNRLAYKAEGTLYVRDTVTDRELGKGPVEGWCFAFSPDGNMLAGAKNYNNNTMVTLWETAGLKKRATLRPSPGVTKESIETPCLTFSPDGKLLAMGGLEALVLWDVSTGKERLRLDDRKAKELLFSSNGTTLACAGEFEIRLWNIGTGERLHARAGHDSWVEPVAVSPDGRIVASVAWSDPVVRLWDAATGKPLPLSPRHDSGIRSCAFASDGRLLISGGSGVVRLLDAGSGAERCRFIVTDRKTGKRNHEILVSHLSVDGKRLAVISMDQKQNQLTLWDACTGELLARRPFGGSFSCFTPDGERVTVDGREQLTIEDTRTGRQVAAIPGDLGSPTAFSSDGQFMAVGMRKTEDEFAFGHSWQPLGVRVIEMASREELFHVDGWINYTAFSPNGHLLATADLEALRLWDVRTGELLLLRPWPTKTVHRPSGTPSRSLAFMPNGRTLATGMKDGTILVWDLAPETWPKTESKRNLDRKQLDTLWTDLASDARKAHRAVYTLAASPTQSLPFLTDHLRPVAVVDAKRVDKLLSDLDSQQFTVREAAAKELTEMGEQIEPALQRVLEDKPTLEVRNRVRTIQEALRGVPPPATLRTLRAIRVLERAGKTETRQILRNLARGAAGAWETRAAKAALERLERQANRAE